MTRRDGTLADARIDEAEQTAVTPRQAKIRAHGIREIWEGLAGDILVIMPVAPADRRLWEQRLQELREDQPEAVSDAPSPDDLANVLGWIQKHYARTVFEGDLAAERSVFYLLSQMYPIGRIRFKFTPDFVEEGPHGPTVPEEAQAELARHTIVLPCGPRANTLTSLVLEALGREDLFQGFQLKRLDEEGVYTADDQVDYGVALKTHNPFAGEHAPQRCFVLAGCHAFGTQAAASAVTMAPLANMIAEAYPEARSEFEIRARIRNADDSKLTYGKPDTMVRIEEPFTSREYKNHYWVRLASELMRTARLDTKLARAQIAVGVFGSLTLLAIGLLVLNWFDVHLVDPVVNLLTVLGAASLWASASRAFRFCLADEG
ncbi:MAG: hypothetical protein ACP5KN_14410 [Armatimonadota bacterium]